MCVQLGLGKMVFKFGESSNGGGGQNIDYIFRANTEIQ